MSSKQWHGGKGSTPRSGNDEQYRSNWDRIFGGIDYGDKDLEKLYHSTEKEGGLQRPQDFDQIDPYTVLPEQNPNKSFNNNGENK